jgi:hypothetical protein
LPSLSETVFRLYPLITFVANESKYPHTNQDKLQIPSNEVTGSLSICCISSTVGKAHDRAANPKQHRILFYFIKIFLLEMLSTDCSHIFRSFFTVFFHLILTVHIYLKSFSANTRHRKNGSSVRWNQKVNFT